MRIQIGPLDLTIGQRKAADLVTHFPVDYPLGPSSGWWTTVQEVFTGAWQRNIVATVENALTHPTFWACVTLIAGDIAKLRVKLVKQETEDAIATETSNPAYSPVLRKPNHYQNRIQFYQYWIISKLTRGNTYVLKERDARNVVTGMYLLDPSRVQPLISPSGDVYYSCGQDWLSGIDVEAAKVAIPAREIIHDLMFPMYHPLVGLSPVYACGHAALQGLTIANNTTRLFRNGTQIGGVLTAPGAISNETAKRLEEYWMSNYAGPQNAGKVAVLGDGLKFDTPELMTAVDSQLIDQLKWGDEKICSTFHVPAYMVGVGAPPNYNNIEALNQQYYSQCLQVLIESLELCLDEGLEMTDGPYGTEFDLEGLLRMDSVQKMDAATKGVVGGIYSPNEGRKKFNLPPVKGGDTPYLQQQNYSLAALDRRDSAAPPPPTPAPTPAPQPEPQADKSVLVKAFADELEAA